MSNQVSIAIFPKTYKNNGFVETKKPYESLFNY